MFGIGALLNLRLGKDPDQGESTIRSIRFGEPQIPPLFAAMQSFYAENPLGFVTITNRESFPITDLEISFFQAEFMDSPTPALTIPELDAEESRDVDLFASFNAKVFEIEGITPLNGEVIVTYSAKGKPAEQRRSVSFKLHDKTALTWDDDRKVAAFITPKDGVIRDYASFIRQATKNVTLSSFNKHLQTAMQVFYSLKEIGCLYQVDPSSPFTKVQEDTLVVDSISLARDTLGRITGDCDDLTVLYASILESVGIETAFVTVPGHIYAALNTKLSPREYSTIHPDRTMTVVNNGELWVPVEITMIGTNSFMEAWRKGVEEWSEWDEEPERRGFFVTREAQEIYNPVGLRQSQSTFDFGDADNVSSLFQESLHQLTDVLLADYIDAAERTKKSKDYNRLGVRYAKYERFEKAKQAFETALDVDRNYLSARINLGSLHFLEEQYQEALNVFVETANILQNQQKETSSVYAKVLVNISKAHYQMSDFDNALEYFAKAEKVDPKTVEEFAYFGEKGSDSSSRAAEAEDTQKQILFVEE